jgi:hypothetical protein
VSSASDCVEVRGGMVGVLGDTGEPVKGRLEKERRTRLDSGRRCRSGRYVKAGVRPKLVLLARAKSQTEEIVPVECPVGL